MSFFGILPNFIIVIRYYLFVFIKIIVNFAECLTNYLKFCIMMKLITSLLFSAMSLTLFTALADNPSEGDYPDLYLKGYDYGGWSTNELYRMTRQGNTYSIHVDHLSSEFKISDDTWHINYGIFDDPYISGPSEVMGYKDAPNFKTSGIDNVDIELIYDLNDNTKARIIFIVDGKRPEGGLTVSGISGTLPVLYINVFDEAGNLNNEVIDYNLSHKNYFTGEYWLDLNDCEWMEELGAESIGSTEEPLPLEIKARGNWTRTGFSKKPFKLKLSKKQRLLGLSKSKHFAILAHADDDMGYLRNYTGFNLGRRIGLPWTPSQQPVEVVINGDYRGLYFLTESIRIEEDRVDITELKDGESDPSLVSGGYLVELDNYDEDYESQLQMPEKGAYPGYKDTLRITFDTPEEYSDYQRMFIYQQFSRMNDLIGENSDDLWQYLDLDDAARYYIVCEIMSHVEAFHGSTYLFRDRGEDQKWHFSPLWDFGNGFNGPTDGYIYDHAPFGMTWVGSMTYNEKFIDKVRETWKWFMSNRFDGIYEDMEQICNHLEDAAKSDHGRWNGQPVPYNGIAVVDNSDLKNRLRSAREHLERKIDWLEGQFGDYNGEYREPERDSTPAAPLPEFLTVNSISAIDIPEIKGELYNLQGVPVANPQPGNIYIRLSGDHASKIMVKK